MKEEYAIDIVELLIDIFEKAEKDCEITIIFGESGKLKQICLHNERG